MQVHSLRTTEQRPWTLALLAAASCLSLVAAAPSNAQTPELVISVVDPTSSTPILPSTRLPATGTKITLAECTNRFATASFVLRPDRSNLNGVTLTPSDLNGARQRVSANKLALRTVKVWYQGGTAWKDIRANSTPTLVPELLLRNDKLVELDHTRKENLISSTRSGPIRLSPTIAHFGPQDRLTKTSQEFYVKDDAVLRPLDLKKAESKQLWLTLDLSAPMSPGQYTGSILIRQGARRIGSVDIHLDILPCRLEEQVLKYGVYYRARLKRDGDAVISSEWKTRSQMLSEFKNLASHGVRHLISYEPLPSQGGDPYTVVTLAKSAGLDVSRFYTTAIATHNPGSPSHLAQYLQQATVLRDLLKPLGVNALVVYGIDEASPELLAAQAQAWSKLRHAGTMVFAAGWRPGDATHVAGTLDAFIVGERMTRSIVNVLHASGTEAYAYNRPQVGVENPHHYRLNYGLELWRSGADGAMLYAYQDGFGFVWNDLDSQQFRDHVFAYPTVDGVIDTVAWEGLREGIDDVRYLSQLKLFVDNPPTNATREAKKYGAEVLSRLREIGTTTPSLARQEIVGALARLLGADIALGR